MTLKTLSLVGFAVLAGSAPALAQQNGSQSDGGGPATLDLPVLGEVELPGFLSFLGSQEASAQGSQGQGGGPPPAVTFTTADVEAVGNRFEFLGRIAAIEQVNVQTRVPGYIQEVGFQGGEFVEAGDLLFQIDTEQYDAAVQSSQASLESAEAQQTEAERALARARELRQSDTVSQAQLEDAIATYEAARASVLEAEAALRQARLDLAYTSIEAPVDGQMSQPYATRGNYVTTTTGAIANLVQLDPIWGVFALGENRLATWRRLGIGTTEVAPITPRTESSGQGGGSGQSGSDGSGQGGSSGQSASNQSGSGQGGSGQSGSGQAGGTSGGQGGSSGGGEASSGSGDGSGDDRTVTPMRTPIDRDIPDNRYVLRLLLPDGSVYTDEGNFDFVGNTVDTQTGTVEVRVRFANPDGILLPNQNVTLEVSESDPPRHPVVPQASITLDREGRSVWVVREDDSVTRVPVEIEPGEEPGTVAVTRGLDGGERVVVRGALRLSEGQTVDPRMAASAEIGGASMSGDGSSGGSGGSSNGGGGAGE